MRAAPCRDSVRQNSRQHQPRLVAEVLGGTRAGHASTSATDAGQSAVVARELRLRGRGARRFARAFFRVTGPSRERAHCFSGHCAMGRRGGVAMSLLVEGVALTPSGRPVLAPEELELRMIERVDVEFGDKRAGRTSFRVASAGQRG